MATPTRIDPQAVAEHQQRGDTLLVCAYDSDEKFEQNHLDDAISLATLKETLDDIEKDRELVFYCA